MIDNLSDYAFSVERTMFMQALSIEYPKASERDILNIVNCNPSLFVGWLIAKNAQIRSAAHNTLDHDTHFHNIGKHGLF